MERLAARHLPDGIRAGRRLESWRGADNGDIHYPIDLETVVALNNESRQPVKGEIYITGPSLIY